MLYGIATATSALLLAAVLSALLRAPALRLGMVDRRRVRPVPLLGGVAVVGSTCLVAAAGGWTGAAPLGDGVGRLLVAGAGVAVLGLVADVWRLKARFLLVGTAVAAAFVVPYDETGVPAGIAAVGWIACVAAAFRGLDHADGLAGTVGVLTAFGAGACAAAEMMDDLAVLLSVLAAALTGFLMHNWHPARMAFGACGSLFTGFLLASAAVLVRTGYDAGSTAAVLFALTAVATADAVLVVLSRRLAGRPVQRRGPDHLAHRLRRLGLTPPGATVLLGAGTFVTVLVGVLVHTDWLAPVGALWLAGVVLAAVLGLLCVRVYGPRRPTELHGTATRSRTGAQGTAPRSRAATGGPGTATRSRTAADGFGTATRSRTVEGYGAATRSRPADPYGTGVRAAARVHGGGGEGADPRSSGTVGTLRSPGVVSTPGAVGASEAVRASRAPRAPQTAHITQTRRQYAS
ncbi:MraY family glycosyltransferase [Streptomyces carpinensis]|uniref:MraY family glycosyltransferase n=1 Tax=Streptomyces carpinensis TaxID=66369 RepID=UPI000A371453|nr:MraY family glycosyltransferase [Streptomyces carpinensis]